MSSEAHSDGQNTFGGMGTEALIRGKEKKNVSFPSIQLFYPVISCL
ncbi:hypothetical protein [Peribacillus loiseleuriae]|nr:hypothetical protein [Peribacillus loiseleuriae]